MSAVKMWRTLQLLVLLVGIGMKDWRVAGETKWIVA